MSAPSEGSIRTVVLGASDNKSRYAYTAVQRLVKHGHFPIPLGVRPGTIEGLAIQLGQPKLDDIHTITLYLNQRHQETHHSYLLSLKPRRIIFNPGAENPILREKAEAAGIETVNGCTLVMLATGTF